MGIFKHCMESTQTLTPHVIICELFRALTVSSIILIILELIQPGIVTAYISLNYWLLFWVVDGILVLYYKS